MKNALIATAAMFMLASPAAAGGLGKIKVDANVKADAKVAVLGIIKADVDADVKVDTKVKVKGLVKGLLGGLGGIGGCGCH
ncbi:MAG: hypothetical protein NW205_00910 [Hyphomicrobiaceae bacterium]|nr:hypothetical protein [Hyphomicrobiaceae bacterium]